MNELNSVVNELLKLPSNFSVQDRVNCLASPVYNKALYLFGFVPLSIKSSTGWKSLCQGYNEPGN